MRPLRLGPAAALLSALPLLFFLLGCGRRPLTALSYFLCVAGRVMPLIISHTSSSSPHAIVVIFGVPFEPPLSTWEEVLRLPNIFPSALCTEVSAVVILWYEWGI
jgi:hypothetical protein